MSTKYDYDTMEREYIESDISIRGLAEKHGISAWSTVHQQAKRRGWEKLRADYRARVQDKTVELVADKKAKLVANIEEDFLKVLHASILKMGVDLRDRTVTTYDFKTGKQVEQTIPGIQVNPQDITKMVATMQAILGKPGAISEERHLGIDLSAFGLDPESLRAIASGTAEPARRAPGRTSLPGSKGAGPN